MKNIKHIRNLGLTFLIAIIMIFSPLTVVADGVTNIKESQQQAVKDYPSIVEQAIDDASANTIENGVRSEWQAIGLARAGSEIPADYMEQFNQNIESQITQGLDNGRIKITDIERLAMAALAIGKDPSDVDGHNLIELIYNSPDHMSGSDTMTFQGNNGPVFALIALDTGSFEIPNDARWTREKLIDYLLEAQNEDGSWALFGTAPSYDMTGMAMIALGKYVEDSAVQQSIEKAAAFLSASQNEDAGFDDPWNGGVSVESAAQVMIGLTTAGIDPLSSAFTKENGNLLDHILSFKADDGGFKHLPTDSVSNGMATEQALQALVAYQLYESGEGRLYDFTQKNITPEPENPELPEEPESPTDTVPPVVSVDGITDGKTYQNERLTFTVKVTDNVDENIVPEIKVNGSHLSSKNGEKYTAKLKEGKNTITITAIDQMNNQTKKSFVVNYKQAKEVVEIESGKQTIVNKGSEVIVKESNTSVKLPNNLPKETKLTTKVLDKKDVAYEGIKSSGDIIDFSVEYPNGTDHAVGSYRLTMGVNQDVDIAKTGIYHFDEATKQWTYVGGFGSAKDGLIAIDVDHFSTYGVFTDTDGPTDVQATEEKVTSNSIALSLSAHDPSGIKEYIIYRDGKEIAIVTGDQSVFKDTDLKAERTYEYEIIAVDQLRNKSAAINVSMTTSKEIEENIAQPMKKKDELEESQSSLEELDHKLPKTATNNFNFLLIGFAFILVGGGLYFIRKKNSVEE